VKGLTIAGQPDPRGDRCPGRARRLPSGTGRTLEVGGCGFDPAPWRAAYVWLLANVPVSQVATYNYRPT